MTDERRAVNSLNAIYTRYCRRNRCTTCGGRGYIEGIGGRKVFCSTPQADPAYRKVYDMIGAGLT